MSIVCVSYFSHCYGWLSDKKQLKGSRVHLGLQFEDLAHHSKGGIVVGVWDVVMLCLKSGIIEQTAGEARA